MNVNLLGKIQVRRGTAAERVNTIFDEGEPAWDEDFQSLFMGDGVTPGGLEVNPRGDLRVTNGLTFLEGNGHDSINGTHITIGMQNPPPVRLVDSADINKSGATISLTMNKVKLVYTFYDANNSKAWVQTISGNEVIDFRRMTVFNGSLDVNSYDGYSLTTTPLNFDSVTYDDSNETTDIVIRENGRVWNVRVFLSGNGSRATMWADLVYDPELQYSNSWQAPLTPGPT